MLFVSRGFPRLQAREEVKLLGSTSHDSVGILIDDRNAERAITGVIENSYYEGRIRVIDV